MSGEQPTADSSEPINDPEEQYAIVRELLDRQDEVLDQLDELDARVIGAIEQCTKSRSTHAEENLKAA